MTNGLQKQVSCILTGYLSHVVTADFTSLMLAIDEMNCVMNYIFFAFLVQRVQDEISNCFVVVHQFQSYLLNLTQHKTLSIEFTIVVRICQPVNHYRMARYLVNLNFVMSSACILGSELFIFQIININANILFFFVICIQLQS